MRILLVSIFLAAVAAGFFLVWRTRRAKYLLISAISYAVILAAYIVLAIVGVRLSPDIATVVGSVIVLAASFIVLVTIKSGRIALIIAAAILCGFVGYFSLGPQTVTADIDLVPCAGICESFVGETVVTYYKSINAVFVDSDRYCKINYGVVLGDFDPALNEPCLVTYFD